MQHLTRAEGRTSKRHPATQQAVRLKHRFLARSGVAAPSSKGHRCFAALQHESQEKNPRRRRAAGATKARLDGEGHRPAS
ncbi:MAG: hypothetical protein A3G27_11195 [Betaproteobacteria bacterium RIFCSPLOWO2_12_FULL_66_14]|nr:MAG: hypothetical protein A3G27_11195 [Betaproteobacteria bacterium RIFCSPLOWO2_12_FULL_66_14]